MSKEVEVKFISQTVEGIENKEEFIFVRASLPLVSEVLHRKLSLDEKNIKLKYLNCHVISEAYVRVFTDFSFTRKTGVFGLPDIERLIKGENVEFAHSWLVSKSAPGWVIDVSPFNGSMTALIVCASTPPWKGMYNESDKNKYIFSEQEEGIIDSLVVILNNIRSKYQL